MRFLVRHRWTALVVCVVLPRLAYAVYEPNKLGDTSRRWAFDVGFQEFYDDNINSTTSNQQSAARSSANVGVTANIPSERTFFRMNSQYTVTYTPDVTNVAKTVQSFVFNGLLSHTFTPRLVVDVNDTVRRALEPAVTDIVNGQSVRLQQQGDYVENNTGATISYGLTRRWLMSLRGDWDLWRYDFQSPDATNIVQVSSKVVTNIVATSSDRDAYSGGVNLAYSLAPRTFVGAGYRYSVNNYVSPGSGDSRNSTSQTLYGSFRHTFNPRLSISVDAGGELDNFGDGSQNTAPYSDMTLNYNYSKDSTVSLGFRYGVTATEVGTFRSTDTGTLFGQVNYQFTLKLHAALNGFYSHSSYQNPQIPISSAIKGQDTFQVELTVTYDFNRWSSAYLRYSYSEVDADIAGNSFTRNNIGIGVNFRY